MRGASATLLTMLNGTDNALVMADCYTVTLIGGQVLRYTSFDVDLSIGGNLYVSDSIKFQRGKVRWVTGLEVDTLDLSIFASDVDFLNGKPFLQQVKNGALDGATIRLDRAFMYAGSYAAEALFLFEGRVADVETGRTEARLKVKSWLEILNVQMPRRQYQAGCTNALFDNLCALNKASYAVSGAVVGQSSNTWFMSAVANAAGWFALGTVTFTSGANTGISRTVRYFSGGVFAFNQPWPNAPAVGDTFTAYPGCDRTLTTCRTKFNNSARFTGCPFIPIPETAY